MKVRTQKPNPPTPPTKRDATQPARDVAEGQVRWAEGGDDEAWHDGWGDDDLGGEDEPLFGDDELESIEGSDHDDDGEDSDDDDEAEGTGDLEASDRGGRPSDTDDLPRGDFDADDDADEADGDDDGSGDEKRRGRRRSKTIARKQMLRERRKMLAQGQIPEILEYDRPRFRSSCRDAERPCLYVSCRYHLYLDVNPVTGSIKLNFPDKEVWDLEETCALDVAERGGITLEEVGEIMNLTRERIRQVEVSGLEKLRAGDVSLGTFVDGRELEGLPLPRKD